MPYDLPVKEIFGRIVNFKTCPRTLKWEMGYLSTTMARWYKEGLPRQEGEEASTYFGVYGETHPTPVYYLHDFTGRVRNDVSAYFNLDEGLIGLPVNCWFEPPFEDKTFYEDENYKEIQDSFGIRKKNYKDESSMPQWVEFPVKNRKDWENYSMPDFKSPYLVKKIKEANSANKDDIAIVAELLGPVTMMYWYFMEINIFSILLFDDLKLIMEINQAYKEWLINAVKEVIKITKVDAFCIADDWGHSTGLLISPEHLKKYFMKYFRDIVRGIKELGFPVIMHNDGCIWEVLDDLVDTGINAYHPVEKGATMDLKRVKNIYKGKLCPIGNVDNKKTMVFGTKDEVIKETLECLKIGAPGGGYIISTDHSLHDDIPEENVWSYINTVKKYGKYPLKFLS